MPAIQVARTDTFEQQRQKINSLGSTLFNITAGGSDLSTGNLKLGDGTRTNPSLAFVSDQSLGIYKADNQTLGFVSSGKKVADFGSSGIYSFKDLIIQQRVLFDLGLSIINFGQNYDPGSYSEVPVIGGTGENATLNINVIEYSGNISNSGSNYLRGSFSGINLSGGSGSGSSVTFDVDGLGGTIEGGSSYIPGTYQNVPLTQGSGTGAIADITITGSTSFSGTISNAGTGYTEGSYTSATVLNSPTSTFLITAVSNASPPPNEIYAINGVNQDTITLEIGNTYWFDISDSSNSQHLLAFKDSLGNDLSQSPNPNFVITSFGSPGQANSFVQLVVKPTADPTTLEYYCLIHANMGGTINVVSGTQSYYGTNALASISVDATGVVTNFELTSTGIDYKQSDIITVYNQDVGGSGSGFLYTIGAPTYEGVVSSVVFTSDGINYLTDDILSASNTDLGGQGSGFTYTITSDPGKIKNFNFITRGSGYESNDILELPKVSSNFTTNLPGQISNIPATLSSSTAVVSLSSTAGLFSGMDVFGGQTDVGQLSPQTTILSVDSLTQITLSNIPSVSGSANLTFSTTSLFNFTVSNASTIIPGSIVEKISGDGVLAVGTTVSSVNTATNTVTLSSQPSLPGTTVIRFIPPYGNPTTDFEYSINKIGAIESVTVSQPGNGYFKNDVITVNSFELTLPITYSVLSRSLQKITFVETISSSSLTAGDILNLSGSGQPANIEIFYVKTNISNNIDYIIVSSNAYSSGDEIFDVTVPSTLYTVDTAVNIGNKFFIDSGNGYELTPNLTLYSGNKYTFDLSDSSNSSHLFSLSQYPGGIWYPSLIESISSTLDTSTKQITVSDTTNILVGMKVDVDSGDGSVLLNTTVESIDSPTTLTLSQFPQSSGSVSLIFRGVEYLGGVTRSSTSLTIQISDTTPNLYYYCSNIDETDPTIHQYEGSLENEDSILSVDLNNLKQFGSDFSIRVLDVKLSDVISADIETGNFTAVKLISQEAEFDTVLVNSSLETQQLKSSTLITESISSENSLLQITNPISVTGNLTVGSNFSITNSNGNLTTSGIIKTTNTINVNDRLLISNNTISSVSGNNILLSPATGRVAKVSSNTAITIPSGTTAQRPSVGIVESGSIRFNTDTNQYEGYSGTSSSWSSLGGVRDLDGNTYITAELSIGSNDNTLWFYNDNINTVKFTPEYQEFVNVKKVRSVNTSAPLYINWTSNTPVTAGQYLKYRNNIYEVVSSGTTGTSGNEPTSTSGINFTNGTATLVFSISAVAPLTFEEISEVRIAPLGGTSLVVNDELSFSTNTISTKVNDLLIQPNTGKKVTINAATSLVLPVGTSNERGNPVRGSVRFNSTILQYEGYDGSNWSSLGGVRDVDGNTYIIPELSPGSNENILYFYNNNSNTLRVTENEIELDTIDTIVSVTSNNLNLDAQLITFNNLAASIDTSSATRTFISTTKDNLDLGLSSGLTNDPLLRLSDTGDIYYNLGFGTGVYNGVKIFDNELKELELADYKILTEDVTLTRNSVNVGSSTIYDPALHKSAKVQIIAHNETTGDKEFVEYSVIDKGSDIFYTDFGNVKTGAELISCVFDFNASSNVRVTFTLDSAISAGNVVKVTVISNIIKR
jgi:hypothetical protein